VTDRRTVLPEPVREIFGSARFAHVLTLCVLGAGFASHALRSLVGWPGFLAILGGLGLLCGISLVARWRAVDWYGVLPISILVFVGWAAASAIWSDYPQTTVTRVLYLILFAFLGVYVALMRDTIQIVRAVGDVLRVLLGLSLALEIFSGLLIDAPIRLFGIQGNIASLGPIQGIFGSRNLLGFVALIALLTFIIEWRTRSVQPRRAGLSVALGVIMLVLAGSPTTYIAAIATVVSATALYGLRRATPTTRWRWQLAALGTAIVATIAGWVARVRIIELLDARGEFDVRLDVWREMSRYLGTNPLQGWGWVGVWPDTPPYTWISLATGREQTTGLNAFVDVHFQLGLIGLFAFLALAGLALVRSWLLASARRSAVYVWPALVLIVLAVTSFAESVVLGEAGWLLLIVCAVKAARDMSWRDALTRP
jgi:O-antigen ligase